MHHHRGLARPSRAETVFPEILPGDTAPQREIRFRPSATVNAADQIPELEKNGYCREARQPADHPGPDGLGRARAQQGAHRSQWLSDAQAAAD